MLRGFDVSNNQGVINWAQVKADAYDFAIVKVTEDTHFADPYFAENWAGAKDACAVRGAYCFTRPENGNPVGQAEFFLQTVAHEGGFQPNDLAMGDFETPAGTSDESAFAYAFLSAVAAGAGFNPLLYCNEDWAANRLTDPRLAQFPLLLACLDPAKLPASIGVWQSVALQQYSWTLTIPGISGPVDGDRVARTLAGLRALGKPAPAPTVISGKVIVPGVLKVGPSHVSQPVPDPAQPTQPYELPVGTAIVYTNGTGKDPTTGESWQSIAVVKPAAHGWLLSKSITADA